jgi:hypothetical protein
LEVGVTEILTWPRDAASTMSFTRMRLDALVLGLPQKTTAAPIE